MRVIYSQYEKVMNVGRVTWELQEKGEVEFLQFGIDYEEFESGPGNFSTAILKDDNGQVFTVRADLIRFV